MSSSILLISLGISSSSSLIISSVGEITSVLSKSCVSILFSHETTNAIDNCHQPKRLVFERLFFITIVLKGYASMISSNKKVLISIKYAHDENISIFAACLKINQIHKNH